MSIYGEKTNIVVFTGNLSYSVRKGIEAIDRAIPGMSWMIVIHAPRKSTKELLRSQLKNLKKNGWRWIPYQGQNVMQRLHDRLLRSRQMLPAIDIPVDRLIIKHFTDIHAEESLAVVSEFAPVLGLSLAAPILKPSLFSIPLLGTLNLHKGKVPDYRGMPPAFWELWNNEHFVGCTVHKVDEGLDSGATIAEDAVDRERFSTLRAMQLQLDETGIQLMCEAVKRVLSGECKVIAQPPGGRTYFKPTLKQEATLNQKLMRHQTPNCPTFQRVLKDLLSRIAFHSRYLGIERLSTPRVTVLLYHRVSDAARDNLTVGIEQFDRQMQLLRKHCTVLPLTELLKMEKVPHSDRPMVCVTFDDGYLDNYANASKILLRYQIPAAFFVSTGLIGTTRTFAHDVRRGNSPIPMMTWDQLREMREQGFLIGSHTVNHIDCAAEAAFTVRQELIQSRDDLRHELGIDQVLFAYPYGGRHHMTPERLELVRTAGYSGCLSAYGGSNVGSINRFNIMRRGIHWEFSDHRFLLACLGLK